MIGLSKRLVVLSGAALIAAGLWAEAADDQPAAPSTEQTVSPSLRWRFSGSDAANALAAEAVGTDPLTLAAQGKVELAVAGPRPSEYPEFDPTNTAVRIPSGKNYLSLEDPGDGSVLDFTNGDSITLAAWVRWDEPLKGSYPYIIGKGRTHSGPGTNYNHNYALRLANNPSGVAISFLFADAEAAASPPKDDQGWHRWTSSTGIPEDGAWHHVAVTYTFGEPDSLQGYIDGEPVKGSWDAGGKTDQAPAVDNDQLWIGSAMGGGSTFGGYLDEVAIHRTALSAEQIKAGVKINIEASGQAVGQVDPAIVPGDRVRVEVTEGVPVARSWKFRVRESELLYETDVFALKELPRKYNGKGLITDRRIPLLLHMATRLQLEGGEYEFLVRSLDSARLYVDGELLAETPFMGLNGSAHGPYYEIEDTGPELLSVAAGHGEKRVTVTLPAGSHVVSLYRLVGNKGKNAYLGETCVGYGPPGGPYRFVSPARELPFTDDGWLTFLDEDEGRLRDWEQATRSKRDDAERGTGRSVMTMRAALPDRRFLCRPRRMACSGLRARSTASSARSWPNTG